MDADLFPPAGNMQPEKVEIDLQFTSGASGAVPTSLTKSRHIKSVTRTAAGTYTVVLTSGTAAFLNGYGCILPTGGTWNGAAAAEVDVYSATAAGTIKFVTVTAAGTATDCSSGDVICVTFVVQRDVVGGLS